MRGIPVDQLVSALKQMRPEVLGQLVSSNRDFAQAVQREMTTMSPAGQQLAMEGRYRQIGKGWRFDEGVAEYERAMDGELPDPFMKSVLQKARRGVHEADKNRDSNADAQTRVNLVEKKGFDPTGVYDAREQFAHERDSN